MSYCSIIREPSLKIKWGKKETEGFRNPHTPRTVLFENKHLAVENELNWDLQFENWKGKQL